MPRTKPPTPEVQHLYQAAVLMGIFSANCGPLMELDDSDKAYQTALRACSRIAADMAAEMIRRGEEA